MIHQNRDRYADMVRVAICDDSEIQLEVIKSRLREYSKRRGIEFDYSVYMDGDSLLQGAEENGGFDLYILDIVMHGSKGTDIAKALRARKDSGYILFYTATEAFSDVVEEVKPCLYFVKTLPAEDFYTIRDQVFS